MAGARGDVKPRLLIVDDEPDMLDFIERVFRQEFQVTRASSADEALVAIASAHEPGGQPFAALITDQKMPKMTGLELLDRATAKCPGLVRLLLSGFSDVGEIRRAAEKGLFDAYVVKPVDSDLLKDAMAEARAKRA